MESTLPEEAFSDVPITTNFLLALRSRLTPYDEMARALPANGRIVDLACGWGLLSLALCRGSPNREVIGIDHDPDRVRFATQAAQLSPANCRPHFQVGEAARYLESVPPESVDGIAMIDMLHYFDGGTQRSLITNAARALRRAGLLIARDIDAGDGARAVFNMLYERLATGVGFTKMADTSLVFRRREEWTQLFAAAGFNVRAEHSGPPFLADVLFIGEKKP